MINAVKDKVQQFLRETLELKSSDERIRIIGITQNSEGWIAEAEVAQRELTLPGHRLFKTERYIVKLNQELEAYSFRQKNDNEEEDTEDQ